MTRCGYIDPKTGAYLKPGGHSQKFWADDYDGRYGLVVFGHTSFQDITYFEHAVGIDCSKFGQIGAVVVSDEDANPITEYYEKTGYSWGSSYSGSSSKSWRSPPSSKDSNYYGKPSSASKTFDDKDFEELAEKLEEMSQPRRRQFDTRDCGLCGDVFGPGEKSVPLSGFPGERFHTDCVENACLDDDTGFGL